MLGTLKSTENGYHSWSKNVKFESVVENFKKLGIVRRSGFKIYVTRFCGGKIKAVFFPRS